MIDLRAHDLPEPSPRDARVDLVIGDYGRHLYRVTGRDVRGGEVILPSVTTLLGALAKPALPGWAARSAAEWTVENLATVSAFAENDTAATVDLIAGAPWRHRDKAAKRGSEAHRLIAAGVPSADVDDEVVRQRVASFESWLAATSYAIVGHEIAVASLRHGWAGTLDLLVRDERSAELGIVDVKTGRTVTNQRTGQLYPEMTLQLAAYAACEIGVAEPVTFGLVLHLHEPTRHDDGASVYHAFGVTYDVNDQPWDVLPPLAELIDVMGAVRTVAQHLGLTGGAS